RPAPNRSMTAKIYRRTYTSELASSGLVSYWRSIPHDTLVSNESFSSDRHGAGSVSFTADQGGEYHVAVEAPDGAGIVAISAVSIYASAAGFGDVGASSDTSVSLKLDRP